MPFSIVIKTASVGASDFAVESRLAVRHYPSIMKWNDKALDVLNHWSELETVYPLDDGSRAFTNFIVTRELTFELHQLADVDRHMIPDSIHTAGTEPGDFPAEVILDRGGAVQKVYITIRRTWPRDLS